MRKKTLPAVTFTFFNKFRWVMVKMWSKFLGGEVFMISGSKM